MTNFARTYLVGPLLGLLWRLVGDSRGQITLTLAIALPALVAAAGVAVDYATMSGRQTSLQGLADAAASAAAREMAVANTTAAQVVAVAKRYGLQGGQANINIDAYPDMTNAIVKVKVSQVFKPKFARIVGIGDQILTARATGRLIGTGKVCALGLNGTKSATVHLTKSARLQANDCGVVSNSTASHSLRVDDSAEISASLICSAGGVFGRGLALDPSPTTDCPKMDDPLASRPEPAFSGCDHREMEISTGSVTLSPGVYCYGLRIAGTAKVNLRPGVYIIKDGPLHVGDQAQMTGENVGFFFAGTDAVAKFGKKSTISLTAPEDGDLAGLLFFEDRANKGGTFRITSDNARTLLGTIYLAKSKIVVDSDGPVADKSAYTAVIARMIELNEGPTLVLNSNYKATSIPAPRGLAGGRVVLSQ